MTIIQARFGSTRLPGKVFLWLSENGKSILEQVVTRAREIGYPVYLTIPTADTKLINYVNWHSWHYYRGPEDDLLVRYILAAIHADHIIRISADCPLLDVEAAKLTVKWHLHSGADFTHYVAEGRGVEVFTRECLERCAAAATDPYEREHIDEHVLRNPDKFRIEQMKFSVDTQEDLDRIRFLMEGV